MIMLFRDDALPSDFQINSLVAVHPGTNLFTRGVRYGRVITNNGTGWVYIQTEYGQFPVRPRNLAKINGYSIVRH